jgi:hypothetical protein
MSCRNCDRTMQGVCSNYEQGIRVYWCSFCGTIKREEGNYDPERIQSSGPGSFEVQEVTWDTPSSALYLQDSASCANSKLALAELIAVLQTKPKMERQVYDRNPR